MAFQERVWRPIWQGGGPLVLWAIYLFGLYVLVALGCHAGWHRSAFAGTTILRGALMLCGALAVTAGVVRVWRDSVGARRHAPGLLPAAAWLSGWLALIGVVWVTLPLLLLPLPCAPG